MMLQSSTRLRRRSRSRFGATLPVVLAITVVALSSDTTNAFAGHPLFPNMAHTVGAIPVAVTTGDLNADGIRDLVVANLWSEDLSILLGLGDGDFAPQRRVPAGGIPVATAVADFNRDGRDDIATALPVEDRVAVFLTQADGSPGLPIEMPAGDSPGGILAADLNRDGLVDLVATNYFSDNLSIWSGHGDGSFGAEATIATGVRPFSVKVALLNGDLYPDLVVASYATGEVLVLLGRASGGFASPAAYPCGTFGFLAAPRQIVPADVDGDGSVDLVVGNFDNVEELNSVALLRGRGDGSFDAGEFVARDRDGAFALGAADFNRDGHPDIAHAGHHGSFCCDARGGSVQLGDGHGGFQVGGTYKTGSGPSALAIDDFNGDDIPDIAATSDAHWGEVAINLGRGDGRMGDEPEIASTGLFGRGLALGDVSGDGVLDIVAGAASGLSVSLGHGDGTFASPIPLALGESPRRITVADLTGDGLADVATLGDENEISYFGSRGGGLFAPRRLLVPGLPAQGLGTGDVTGDGIADLLLTVGSDDEPGNLIIVSLPGTASEAVTVVAAGTQNPRNVVRGDFDHDGSSDVAIHGQELVVLRGLGAGTFSPPMEIDDAPDFGRGLLAVDLDGDGADDLVEASENYPGMRVIYGGTHDPFTRSEVIDTVPHPIDLVPGDFDGNGRNDVATLDSGDLGDVSLVLNLPVIQEPVAPRVLAQTTEGGIASGDVDGDHRIDLLVSSEDGNVVLIRNQGPFPNHAPRARPGAENVLECTGPEGAPVALDGRGSTDPDSTPEQDDLATFEWFEDFGDAGQRLLAQGAVAEVTLPLGEHSLTLRVTDRAGASDTAEFIVEVVDSTAPTAGASMTPARLWPPNHLYTTVRADLVAADRCGPVSVTLVSAKSSEPDDILGGADGSTRDDIAGAAFGTADFEVLLRAERNGLGAGRTYTLTWRVEDGSGNVTEVAADVLVPFSQSGRGGTGVPPAHGTGGGSNNGGSNGNGRPGGPRPHPTSRH